MNLITAPHYLETCVATTFPMIHIPGGNFLMGSEAEDADDDEQPVHRVEVSDFFLGQYLVTQRLWHAVMGTNPSRFKGWDRPVERVSWHDCHAFIDKLNTMSERPYRLPTEAEWEYAARGGPAADHYPYPYAGSSKLEEAGWYDQNSQGETQPVGLKLPNPLGLYDMSGNVSEWCEDDWHEGYQHAPDHGSAWIDQPRRGDSRVRRGGGWIFTARYCRVSCRSYGSPGHRFNRLGFRLAS